MNLPIPYPSGFNEVQTIPTIESIFQKSFPLTSNRKIVLDFNPKTYLPFLIKDIEDSESKDSENLKTLALTTKSLNTLLSNIESYQLSSTHNDPYTVQEYKIPIGGNKGFILTQSVTANSKKYLDSRLWMRLNSLEEIPTKRGFRCEIKDIHKVLEGLTSAKQFYEYFRFKTAKHIEYSVIAFAMIADEKRNIPVEYSWDDNKFSNWSCKQPLDQISWGLISKDEAASRIREIINSIQYFEFEKKFKDYFELYPQIELASVFQYIKRNDEVSLILFSLLLVIYMN